MSKFRLSIIEAIHNDPKERIISTNKNRAEFFHFHWNIKNVDFGHDRNIGPEHACNFILNSITALSSTYYFRGPEFARLLFWDRIRELKKILILFALEIQNLWMKFRLKWAWKSDKR